jgi:hypothetical protein
MIGSTGQPCQFVSLSAVPVLFRIWSVNQCGNRIWNIDTWDELIDVRQRWMFPVMEKLDMIGYSLSLFACISAWLSPNQPLPVECVVNPSASSSKMWQEMSRLRLNPKSSDRLYQLAETITVKVKARQNGGSGILIERQGPLYTVLTNRHVVNAGSPYLIQTPDGRTHPANLLKKFDFRGNDLALVQFRSSFNYAIAPLASDSVLKIGDSLISAGFPLELSRKTKLPGNASPNASHHFGSKGFLITTGQVSLIPKLPFQGGYQIGYSNQIYQGMSGGPVLNREGQVIGINSLHAYPLWGDPYIFNDGSHPPPQQRLLIIQSSWAVPITTFLCLTTSRFSSLAKNQSNACAAKLQS